MSSFATNPGSNASPASSPAAGSSLSLPGPREVIDSAAKVSSLISSLPPSVSFPSLTSLSLGNKSYTEEGSAAISETLLKHCKSVTSLDLADVIAGRPEAEGLKVLSTFSKCAADNLKSLVSLDLSDNAMGLKGISQTMPLFEKHRGTLRELSMCNDGLSHQSMEEVKDIVTKPTPIQFKKLHFYNNMSGDPGCQHFQEIVSTQTEEGLMEDLRFSGTRASSEGSIHIADCLIKAAPLFKTSLLRLDLNDNTFTTDALAAAFEAGLGNALVSLNLGECSMEDETTTMICDALAEYNKTLTELDLSGNDLTADSMPSLSKIRTLESLALNDNEIETPGLVALLPLPPLVSLSLNFCGLTDKAAKKLTGLSSISQLRLDGNAFTPAAVSLLTASYGPKLEEMEDNDEDGGDDSESENEDEEVNALADAVKTL